jgi:post-segregation antitoxin (ccd killing protein)
MPRMQVYLPTDLYEKVKERRLPASELLQDAVRAEVRRRKLQDASRRYTAELAAEVGQATPRQRARAAGIAQRVARRAHRKAC